MLRKMNIVELFLNNAATKSVAVSILVGAFGWTAHTLIITQSNGQTLTEHTAQLNSLEEGQKDTREVLQLLSVTIAKMDGKLDVVNQKIDDDRRAAHRAHPPL